MFINYLTTAFRNISRNKGYTFLNITGLTLSLASCLVIFLIVKNELSYDAYHAKAVRTYRVTLNALDFNPSVSMAVVPALRADFPELEEVSQYFYQEAGMVRIGENRYNEKGFAFADQNFLHIFDYQWLAGDSKSALAAPNSIVLTQTMAKKYFGTDNVIGKSVNLNKDIELLVTGLIKDVPGNTSMPFTFLVSFETIKKGLKGPMSQFYAIMGGNAFVVVPKNYSIAQLQRAMPGFIKKNWGDEVAKDAKLLLQPLTEIHFDQRYLHDNVSPTTSRETYWALAAVALFIIITACINFINLATAQAIKRAKEVGVRKVLGATRMQLIRQFLGETTFLVIVSLLLGTLLAIIFLPTASRWLSVNVGAASLLRSSVLSLMALVTVFMILAAGLYPAFVQSAFTPAKSLKNTSDHFVKGLTLRKILVLVQFMISQTLIVGTLVIASQMDYFVNQDLGFNKAAVVSVSIPDRAKREAFAQQLRNAPGISDISFNSGAPAYNNNATDFTAPELGLVKGDVTEVKFVDEHFMDMFGLQLLAGKKVFIRNEKDTSISVVVNESMLEKMGIKEPGMAIGSHVYIGGNYSTVTGVIKDFQSESKHKKRRPCVLIYSAPAFFTATLRIQPAAMRKTLVQIDKAWSGLFPENVFEYEFLDDHIASLYKQEQKMYTAFKLFSFLAILIGCLGLYGLVNIAAVQRIKEVGVRKILGASILNIVSLFAKEFIGLIIAAFVLSAPVAYILMHSWLENFAYQAPLGAGIFLVAICVSLLIAAVTIAHRALKAAVTNPAESLRTE